MKIQKYDARYEFRCFTHEIEFWRKMAAKNGLSLADYVRSCLNEGKIFKCKQVDPTLLRQISAIGNNINQIAYWVNTYKSKADAQLVVQRLDSINKNTKAFVEQKASNVD